MKTVLLVNPNKSFEPAFRKAAEMRDLAVITVDTLRDLLIYVDAKGTQIYIKGAQQDISNFHYTFIRRQTKNPLITSLLATALHNKGVAISDEANLYNAPRDNKLTQMVLLGQVNLHIPKTFISNKEACINQSDLIVEKLGLPCVLKEDGARGEAVWKIATKEELLQRLNECSKEEILVQEFIPNTEDFRVIVFKGVCLGAIERRSVDGFYNNVSRGGTVSVSDITDEEREFSAKACDILGLDFGGVDFIRQNGEVIFLEVNKAPQLTGFEKATGMDVAAKIVESL